MTTLKTEIAQKRPFTSQAEEALLNLLRTADCIHRTFQHTTRPWGITGTQYNVLRILRGVHPAGLTCSAIGDRMITAVPDITRLLARLKALKLIRQQRDKRDRRVLWTNISESGLALLEEMDKTVAQFPTTIFGHLSPGEMDELIRHLESARGRCQPSSAPPTCDGTTQQRAPGAPNAN